MSKLYYLKYTQESEAYVEADSADEARDKISDYTKGGGDNMHNIRLNEAGWSVYSSMGELTEIDDNHLNAQFDTHEAGGGTYQQQDEGFIYYD
jgi:hypothetical protein|tara:strand:+ start:656 stop:934 length:279 start_codon:yes stop_codon:yes gene_type:complete